MHLPVLRGPLPEPTACAVCPLSVNGLPQKPVRGLGPSNPLFIVIAEGPGVIEHRESMPMMGPSGKLLNRALNVNKINRNDIYVGNTTLCLPPKDGKEAVVAEASKCCRKRLEDELAMFPSETPILLTGKHAAQAFLGNKFKITELSGSYHEVEVGGVTRRVIPTIHPAAILRGGGDKGAGSGNSDLQYWGLLYDINKIVGLAKGTEQLFSEDIHYEWKSGERASQLVEWICREIRKVGKFALDTETLAKEDCQECPSCEGHTTLEAMHARLNVVGLATEKHAISVPWGILDSKAKQSVKDILGNPKIIKYFHNSIYDVVVMHSHGMPTVGEFHDTLYMHHNCFPGLPHKLQRVATQFFLIRPWKSEHEKEGDGMQELLRYNALDVLSTMRLVEKLKPCLDRAKGWTTYAMDMRKVRMAIDMQLKGVPLDLDRNAMFMRFFTPLLEEAKQKLLARMTDGDFKQTFKDALTLEQAKTKRKDDSESLLERQAKRAAEFEKKFDFLNLNSPKQVPAYLKACGIQLTERTKSGQISSKKDVLESLIGHAAVRELVQFRENAKSVSTFVEPFAREVYADNRFHPTWSPNKISGRFGSKRNTQNWNKGDTKYKTYADWEQGFLDCEDVGSPNLRWQVKPVDGRCFVGIDYRALEARVVALLAKDKWLCEIFSNEGDIHSILATDVFPNFNDVDKHERKALRDLVKRAEYGFFYGAAVMTVWQSIVKEGINIPISQIVHMFNVFQKKMPSIPKFHASLYRQVMEKGYIESFLCGRKRFFPLGEADDTIIKNFICQASGADIADTGILKLYDNLPPTAHMLIHGHDAALIECDVTAAEDIKALAISCMEQTYVVDGISMKFSVEADIGESWGAA